MGALGTCAIGDAILQYIVPGTLDEKFAAFRTQRVSAVAENISFVDVMQSRVASNFARAMQSFRRRARFVLQFEVGMKCGEVQRHVGAKIRKNPVGKLARFGFVVVERRNHQIRELEPNMRLVFEAQERFENRFEMRQRNFAVEILGEGFQIHIRCIDVIVNVVKGFARDVAVRHHRRFQAVFVRDVANVDDVFGPDGRLVVSERDRGAAMVDGKFDDLLRFEMRGVHLIAARFRNVPVLTEEAAHVASRGAEGKNFRAGEKMIERFFFDGINLNRGRRRVAEAVKFSALINADETEAGLSVSDMAMARAEIAMHFAHGVEVPPTGFVERIGFLENVEIVHF